jgi:hypothetical protein
MNQFIASFSADLVTSTPNSYVVEPQPKKTKENINNPVPMIANENQAPESCAQPKQAQSRPKRTSYMPKRKLEYMEKIGEVSIEFPASVDLDESAEDAIKFKKSIIKKKTTEEDKMDHISSPIVTEAVQTKKKSVEPTYNQVEMPSSVDFGEPDRNPSKQKNAISKKKQIEPEPPICEIDNDIYDQPSPVVLEPVKNKKTNVEKTKKDIENKKATVEKSKTAVQKQTVREILFNLHNVSYLSLKSFDSFLYFKKI